jgi:thioredoxin reductase (NADPH)
MSEHDVVITGGGLAGLTAGVFSARLGLSTVVLTGMSLGGQLMSVEGIEDFPGFPDGVTGYELCPGLQDQAANAGADFAMEELVELAPDDGGWTVTTAGGEHRARAVIVATGSAFRPLDVSGEERLIGKGVSHCASCDGPLFRDAAVGVVGGGDTALQEALALTTYGCRVIVFDKADAPRAQQTYRARVEESEQIELRPGTVVEEVLGDTRVEGVRVRELASDAVSEVQLAGLFPCVGLVPNTSFLADLLALDDGGSVPTDASMRTARPGLLAAGDIRTDSARQAITSAGDGATAAFTAHRYLADGSWA